MKEIPRGKKDGNCIRRENLWENMIVDERNCINNIPVEEKKDNNRGEEKT